MKRKLALLVLTVFMIMPSLTVAAGSIADLQQQQEAIRQEAHEARGELSSTQREMENLEAEIIEMDRVLDEATEQLEITEQALEETITELEETEAALEEAQEARDEHFDRFKTRLRVMYMHGPVGYLEVVLQATSFSDFLTRLDHMNTIARSDRDMVERMQEAEDLVAEKLEETFRHMTRIEALRIVQAERIVDLNHVLDQKSEFMFNLEGDAHQAEARILHLEQSSRDITAEIQRIQAEERRRQQEAAAAARRAQQVVHPRGGRMSWPVPGHYRVSSHYGNRTHPISRRAEFHTGVDIPAPSGTSIIAAAAGTVIISGRMGGYGNTVVIDHGGGLTTLYGHNSRNLVNVGDVIYRGQEIARVGSTGVSTGPHLHFEVRHDGRHVSPNEYLGI